MQKPTLCIYADTHALMKYTRVYNTPHEHLLLLVFEDFIEVSQVSESQKQALVNALKYVCSLTL